MASREDRYEEPKVVITIPHNSLWAYRGPVKSPVESASFIMACAMSLNLVFFLAVAVSILQSPISRDYYLGEIPHCFTDKCITGAGAEKRLDALGVKYKNSPEDYAKYKMWKFQEVEAKKEAAQKARLMNH